jgi:hypothetical protein
MTSARVHIGIALAVIGILVATDTVLLLSIGRRLFPSQDVLSLTACFVILQEAILLGLLTYITMTAGRSSIALPVHLGYVSVLASCSLFAFLVIAVFDALLTLGVVGIGAFWKALAVRQASLLILLLGVHIVGIVQRASHQQAEQQRADIEDAMRACDRIAVVATLSGWEFDGEVEETRENLRFSEVLRQDQPLFSEVLGKLSQLESLARTGGDGEPKANAERLLKEVLVLSSQRR